MRVRVINPDPLVLLSAN
ncbi:hypothetical protein PENARI_c195G08749 [Penicillium arizonense]|uniref:Uncharacterized protein n=1 Tax=Penicillium arizonense TaxID=1835702 RepID=A0A1F5KZY2_PENAI|nr:hypothetical protein PENARI_c195G08749 [Penicillium arizonense]